MSEVGDDARVDQPDDEQNKPSFPIGKWVAIIFMLVLLGLGAYMLTERVIVPWLTGKGERGDKMRAMRDNVQEAREKKKKMGKIGPVIPHPIKGITANTAGSRGRRFVTFDLIVETRFEDARDEMVIKEYQIRDALITFFGGRSVGELATRKFMTDAKDTVQALINRLLETGEIDTVYFTKFLIQ